MSSTEMGFEPNMSANLRALFDDMPTPEPVEQEARMAIYKRYCAEIGMDPEEELSDTFGPSQKGIEDEWAAAKEAKNEARKTAKKAAKHAARDKKAAKKDAKKS